MSIPVTYNPQSPISRLQRLPASVLREVRGRLESTSLLRINLGYRRNGGGLASGDAHVIWVVDPNLFNLNAIRLDSGYTADFPNGLVSTPQGRVIPGEPPSINPSPLVVAQGFTRTSNRFLVKIAYPYFAAQAGGDWLNETAVMDGGTDYFNEPVSGNLPRWFFQNRLPEDGGQQVAGLVGPYTDWESSKSLPYWYPIGGADAQGILGTQILDNLASCCALDAAYLAPSWLSRLGAVGPFPPPPNLFDPVEPGGDGDGDVVP